MTFMQVFKRPGQQAYSYQVSATSLEMAATTGRELARRDKNLWGEFCYARPTRQLLIRLNEFYVLQPSNLHMRYRKESEELNAPFDYLPYEGRSGDSLAFPLIWVDPVSTGSVQLVVMFDSAKAGKFWDLCKEHLAKFVLGDNGPRLQFFDRHLFQMVGEIPLRHQN